MKFYHHLMIFVILNLIQKKLKPAYFNKADVKVPYEKSRFQFLQLMIHPKGQKY